MIITDLQRIYDERDYWYNEWFHKYKETVSKFINNIKNDIDWTDDDLYLLICAQDNHIANNGQWGTIYNTDKNPEYKKILHKWSSELLPIIQSAVKEGDISTEEFSRFRKIIFSCCKKKKKLAANRIMSAFLPEVLTTTVDENEFLYVENKLKERLSDYNPPETDSWLVKNKYFKKYCNDRIAFEDSWQSSIFNWMLRENFKWEEEQTVKKIEEMNTYKHILQSNYNLMLTGAPGTGKTYLAKQIAAQLILGKEYKEDNATDEEKAQMNEQCKLVQFHPSYDYTDLVEGLRPIKDAKNEQIGFERKDGTFKTFCARALKYSFDKAYDKLIEDIVKGKVGTIELKTKTSSKLSISEGENIHWYSENEANNISSNAVSRSRLKSLYKRYNTLGMLEAMPNIQNEIKNAIGGCDTTYYWGVLHYLLKLYIKPFVFIIDEINRGEISKIFGELFFSIDPGYRGTAGKVQTQYQNLIDEDDDFYDGFYVPENVYIIGTMNDIDRSVESMDFAFRRRFTFKEIKANENVGMLDGLEWKDKAIERMTLLNEKIEKIEGLSSAYHIGASYFLKLTNYDGDFNKLWDYHLEGLLREYLRGMQYVEGKIKQLKEAYGYESDSNNGQ